MNEEIVKHLNFGESAKDKVFSGINKLTKAVSSTLGASGKCVMLEDGQGNPIITKDGVTVANSIILLDPVENMGSKLLKEAARKTVREAGDGTTTATVLAHAILEKAYKVIDTENVRDLKEGINNAVDKVIDYLEKNSKVVSGDAIKQVATISSNNDVELGEVISEAFKSVDETGVVMMEVNEFPETFVENVEGMQYERGLKSAFFVNTKEKDSSQLDNPLVLLVENEISNVRQIQNVLEHCIKKNKSLLIIADTSSQVASTLAMNQVKGVLKINLLDAPTYGVSKREVFEDLSLMTGAIIVNEDLGDDIDLISIDNLGTCKKCVSSQTETIIKVDNIDESVDSIIKDIKKQIQKANHPGKIKNLEKRLARLSAKLAIVKVGANSEIELKEKRDRVEDAIYATRAAIKEGIVPGGGIALLNASDHITAKGSGEQVLLDAIRSPYLTILENAGIRDYDAPKVKGKGLDVVTGKTVSMVKSGIIDPLLVTKRALINAASVATTILSTDCVINNLRADAGNR